MADATLQLDLDGNFDSKVNKATAAAKGFEKAADGAAGGSRRLGAAVGNVGHQIQDVAVQFQAGTAAATIFAQQGPQILGAFGPMGAVLGAALAIGVVGFQALSASAKENKDAIAEATDSYAKFKAVAGDVEGLQYKYGALAAAVGEFSAAAAATDALVAADAISRSITGLQEKYKTAHINATEFAGVSFEDQSQGLSVLGTATGGLAVKLGLSAAVGDELEGILLSINHQDFKSVINGTGEFERALGRLRIEGKLSAEQLDKLYQGIGKELRKGADGAAALQARDAAKAKSAAEALKNSNLRIQQDELDTKALNEKLNADDRKKIQIDADTAVAKAKVSIYAQANLSQTQKLKEYEAEASKIRADEANKIAELNKKNAREEIDASLAATAARQRQYEIEERQSRTRDRITDSAQKGVVSLEDQLRAATALTGVTDGQKFAIDQVHRIELERMRTADELRKTIGAFGEGTDEVNTKIAESNVKYDQQLALVRQIAEAKDRRKTGTAGQGVESALDLIGKRIPSAFETAEAKTLSVFNNMESALDNFVDTGKLRFKDFAGSVIRDLIKIELKAQATSLLRLGLGSLFGRSTPFGGSTIGGPFGGAARGGLVTTGGVQPQKLAMGGSVGVEGQDSIPTLLMPGEYVLNKGQVNSLKNGKGKGGGMVVNNYYTIQGYTDQQLVQKVQATIVTSNKLVYGAAREGERQVGSSSFR